MSSADERAIPQTESAVAFTHLFVVVAAALLGHNTSAPWNWTL
jgi:hypothetical protein